MHSLNVPEKTKIEIDTAIRLAHDENSSRVQAWQSKQDYQYWTVYSASVELNNGVTENLRAYGKLLGALDFCQQILLWQSGHFLRPTRGMDSTCLFSQTRLVRNNEISH